MGAHFNSLLWTMTLYLFYRMTTNEHYGVVMYLLIIL